MASKSIQQKIIDRLTGDNGTSPTGAILVGGVVVAAPPENNSWSGILTGGAWGRRIKPYDPKDPNGATKEAFSNTGYIRPAVYLKMTPWVPHPQMSRFPKAVRVTANFFVYSPSHQAGNDSLEAAVQRITELMDDWSFKTDIRPGENNGPIAFSEFAFRMGPEDNHTEFLGSRVDILRYDFSYRRAFET